MGFKDYQDYRMLSEELNADVEDIEFGNILKNRSLSAGEGEGG